MKRPSLTLIGGPNGSGKSTLLEALVSMDVPIPDYHNADDISRTLTGTPEHIAQEAQRRVQHARGAAIEARRSFTYETVMSHPSHLQAMQRAVDGGGVQRVAHVMGKFVVAFPTVRIRWPGPCLLEPLRAAGYTFQP